MDSLAGFRSVAVSQFTDTPSFGQSVSEAGGDSDGGWDSG